jgi:vacuolar-type H+-ATPase subunit E/Vma4
MNKKQSTLMIYDREVNGLSYRTLGKKYGIGSSTARRMMMRKQDEQKEEALTEYLSNLPDDIKLLKEELRKEKLKNELLNLVIDISSKELGVDLRKKHGTRQ